MPHSGGKKEEASASERAMQRVVVLSPRASLIKTRRKKWIVFLPDRGTVSFEWVLSVCDMTRRVDKLGPNVSETALLWRVIQDLVGPGKIWPRDIVKLMFSNELGHQNRLKIITFLHINGCDPRFVQQWFNLRSKMIKAEDRFHVKALFKEIIEGITPRSQKFYAFSLSAKRNVHLGDGSEHRNFRCTVCGR